MPHRVTLIPGDGIGPEIAEATRRVLDATGVAFDWDVQEAGRRRHGQDGGNPLPDAVIESIAHTASPSRGRSPRRSAPASAASTSPCARRSTCTLQSAPARATRACARATSDVDLVIVRENTEDLYAGIEFEEGTETRRAARHDPEALGRRDPRGLGHLDQADLDRGHAAHRPVRLRVRPPQGTPQGHRRPQGQHHEVHRRPLPARRARGRRGLPRHRVRGSHRRQHVHAARAEARAVRRAGAARTSTATSSPTSAPAWSAASASRRARTSAPRPRCSSPPTAARRSTPARTRSTRRR